MAVTHKDRHVMLSLPYMSIVLQYTFQQGQPPSFPQVYNMKGHASRGSQSTINRSSVGIQAWPNLNAWRPCKSISREVETNFQQEGSSLCISRDLVLKKTLSFKPDSRGMWMPNYEDPCAATPVTTNVDKPACWCNQEILCQNIQKSIKSKKKSKRSSMSRKPEKAT